MNTPEPEVDEILLEEPAAPVPLYDQPWVWLTVLLLLGAVGLVVMGSFLTGLLRRQPPLALAQQSTLRADYSADGMELGIAVINLSLVNNLGSSAVSGQKLQDILNNPIPTVTPPGYEETLAHMPPTSTASATPRATVTPIPTQAFITSTLMFTLTPTPKPATRTVTPSFQPAAPKPGPPKSNPPKPTSFVPKPTVVRKIAPPVFVPLADPKRVSSTSLDWKGWLFSLGLAR
jgi:hypothetical protein